MRRNRKVNWINNLIGISNDLINKVKYEKINKELNRLNWIFYKKVILNWLIIFSNKLIGQIMMEITFGVIEDKKNNGKIGKC